MASDAARMARYARQVGFAGLGPAGQRALGRSRALIVGVGGLGSRTAELLARAGVGFLRLADDDRVDATNLHRQALYDESDASAGAAKVDAAARRLREFNAELTVEAVPERLDARNVEALAGDVDLVLDGTDRFPSRFVINDYCVKTHRPWVFAGVVGAEAQTMTIVPGRGPCLRCVYGEPPPPCVDPTCQAAGVLGPAVAAIASIQALEALKLLAGRVEAASPYLLKLDLWNNTFQRIDVRQAAAGVDCPCCQQKDFEFLEW